MYQDAYYIAKVSGTYADALAAFGLARLLQAMTRLRTGRERRRMGQNRITLHDVGWAYEVRLPEPLDEAWVKLCPFIGDLAPLIEMPQKPKAKKAKATSDSPADTVDGASPPMEGIGTSNTDVSRRVDLDETWSNIRALKQIRELDRQHKTQRKRQELQQLREQFREPGQDVNLLIGDYRIQANRIHNQAVLQWHQTRAHFSRNLTAILEMCAGQAASTETVAKAWARDLGVPMTEVFMTCSQLFNPSMGKGQNRTKADQLAMGNLKEFWLLVYLKVAGLHGNAVSRQVSKEDSRKVYVLLPEELSLAWHQDVLDAFQRALPTATSVRLDVLASLAYAQCWLANSTIGQTATESGDAEYVSGLAVATYRLLSQHSYTMINLATLGLPPWLRGGFQRTDINVLKEVIDEQRRIIEPLREDRNTEYNLLVSYRDFLTGQRLDAFFDFCAGYGEHVLRVLEKTDRVRQVSVRSVDELLRRLAMPADDLTEFATDPMVHPGFHQIARAIYESTIRPQRQKGEYRRGKGDRTIFEVRYGLANKLRGQSDNPESFMQALAEFVQIYNAETDQQYENATNDEEVKRAYRPRIRLSDLDDVMGLLKRYTPALVCNMLMAYGYAARGTRPGSSQPATDPAEGADGQADDEELEEDEA